jgi:hypothetical protein
MQTSEPAAAARATLQYVLSADMPSEHKAVLIDLLTQALRDHDTNRVRQQAVREEGDRTWQEDETTRLSSLLLGKIAKSWQNADELLMYAAAQLHRTPPEVRAKALELGLGASIDFNVAKTHVRMHG